MTSEPPNAPRRSPAAIRASIAHDRSPHALRAALPAEDHDRFDREYRQALDEAWQTYDWAPLHSFEQGWWCTAVAKADPEEYRRVLETAEQVMQRVRRGEPTGGIPWEEVYETQVRPRLEAYGLELIREHAAQVDLGQVVRMLEHVDEQARTLAFPADSPGPDAAVCGCFAERDLQTTVHALAPHRQLEFLTEFRSADTPDAQLRLPVLLLWWKTTMILLADPAYQAHLRQLGDN